MLSRALVAAVLTCGGCMGSCDTPTAPDSCTDPGVGAASSLELGQAPAGSFQPLAEGDVVPRVFGSQGGAMITVALRLRGDVPSCLEQHTEAFVVGQSEPFEIDSVPRKTYGEADGSRTTREMFLILDYDTEPGAMVRIVTTAAGLTAERTVHVEFEAPDGGLFDAGSPDAGAVDAGTTDGNPSDAAAMLDAG